MQRRPGKLSIQEYNSVLALASDPGLCGIILRSIEGWVIREAARWEDTWDFLLGVRGLSQHARQFCRAAKSANAAMYRLARMARGVASTRTDLVLEHKRAVESGDAAAMKRLEAKLVKRTEQTLPGWLERDAPPALQSMVAREVALVRTRQSRRIGGRKLTASLSFEPDTRQLAKLVEENYPREFLLINGWLRLPNGDPGLCFFSQSALAYLFVYLGFGLSSDADAKEASRTRLRRLGLVQGPVMVTAVHKRSDGRIILTRSNCEKHLLTTGVKTGSLVRYTGAP